MAKYEMGFILKYLSYSRKIYQILFIIQRAVYTNSLFCTGKLRRMKRELAMAVRGKVKPIKKLLLNINVTNKYLVVANMFITVKNTLYEPISCYACIT